MATNSEKLQKLIEKREQAMAGGGAAAVEKHHIVGVVRDQQHGREGQEDPVGGMHHQAQLVP